MTDIALEATFAGLTRVTCDLEARTISGIIVLFDRASSDGRMFAAGSITPRQPIGNVKLLTEHDENRSIGYMTHYVDHGTHAEASFRVADGPAGDEALANAANRTRDGFSVGALASKYHTTNDTLIYDVAELVEVSLVSVPAFNETRITPKEAPVDPETETPAAEQPAAAAATPVAASASAEPPALAPAAPIAQTASPGVTVARTGFGLNQAIKHVAAAFNTGNPAVVQAALADIVPSEADPDGVILRNEWLGELWSAAKTGRPWIESFGTPQQLTSLKGKGYRWTTKPQPGKYAGEKAEVPTGKVATEEVEFTAERWAGGWDIDRAFIDFADSDFLAAFWAAAVEEYNIASDQDIATKVIAAARTITASDSLVGALRRVGRELRTIGASASRIVMGDELFDEWSELTIADVPHWLANAVGGVNLTTGQTNLGQIVIDNDPTVAARQIVAYDKRAATVRERSPIQVKALDVAHAGIDLGFYSYGRLDVHDPRAIVKTTVTAPTPPAGD